MKLTAENLASKVGGRLSGDSNRLIEGAAGLLEATDRDVSFLKDEKKAVTMKDFKHTRAAVVLVPWGVRSNGKTLIEVGNPIKAFSVVLTLLADEKKNYVAGIHPLACVSKSAKIGKNATIGPFCVIEDEAEIGESAQILAQVYIGRRSKIGSESILYPQVVIREDVQIGNRCIVHAGAILGSDGYGFYFENGKHNKIPQIGQVIVEDDVEIGSCTTIDRATTGATIIRKGTKIDNLVQIAHNVDVGAHSLLVAQVGIAGSSTLGRGVVLAGQVGIADHVHIGDGAQVGAQSGIKDDVAPGEVLFGSPAQPLQDAIRQALVMRKLPDLFKDVKKMKEKVYDRKK